MLQTNYEISRREGETKELIFHPDASLKKIEGNAIYLEAPNAKGKSTLLNILAISMYGHKLEDSDSRISPTLKSNIKYMMQREDQNFTFDVKFSSKDGKIQLMSKKDSPNYEDIHIQEINNGQIRTLPYQVFKDEYYLVYDIPEDPLNRLKEIIVEVEHQQDRYKKRVSEFKSYLEEIKREIASSRDEDAIQELKTSIEKFTVDRNDLESEIKKTNEEIETIESFYALREYKNYAKLSASLIDRIERKKVEAQNIDKIKKKHDTAYLKKKKEIETLIDSMAESISELTIQLKNIFIESTEMKQHLEEIENFDIYQSIETFNIDLSIDKKLKYVRKNIDQYKEKKEIKEAGKKGEFFEEILEVLNEYKGIDVSIPGTGKSIEELIKVIQQEYDKNKGYTEIYTALNQCNQKILQIQQTLNKLPNQLDSLKIAFNKQKETSETVSKPQDLGNEIENLDADLKKILDKIEKYRITAERYGFNVDEMNEITIQEKIRQIMEENNQYMILFQQGEGKISEHLERINKENERKKGQINQMQYKLDQYTQKLSDLEKREKHKYNDFASEIEEISSLVDSLEFDLINCGKIVRKINGGENLQTEQEIKYNDKISQYLALKIPEFAYIDKFLKPQKIDFVHKIIYTNEGREISMRDISTGQAMSMYIQAILNRPSDDKRKLIVIFDEASTMDSNSFRPIKKTLKHLIDENKLIFALFARAIDGEMRLTEIV